MKLLWVVLASASALLAEVNARDLVRQSIQNYERDSRSALNYTYLQRDVERKGSTTEISVSQVIPIAGSPYERLVAKNGQPLTGELEQKEQAKYQKVVEQREHETAAEKQKRLADYAKQRQFLREVPDAYDFTILREEPVNGRMAYVIQCTPKEDYAPQNSRSKLFKGIQAKLWIDKQDVRWAKAEANVIDTVSFGLILARVGKGSNILMEQKRMAEGAWLPARIDINGNARIMLVHNKGLAEQLTYSDFRKVQPGDAVAIAKR